MTVLGSLFLYEVHRGRATIHYGRSLVGLTHLEIISYEPAVPASSGVSVRAD